LVVAPQQIEAVSSGPSVYLTHCLHGLRQTKFGLAFRTKYSYHTYDSKLFEGLLIDLDPSILI